MKYKRKHTLLFEAIQYPGHMTEEVEAFIGKNLKSEARDGIGVIGYWIENYTGETHMLERDHYICKRSNGTMYTIPPFMFESDYEPA